MMEYISLSLRRHQLAQQEFKKDIVGSLEKERSSDIETWAIGRVSNKEIFMEKVCRKCTPNTNPRPPFNFYK